MVHNLIVLFELWASKSTESNIIIPAQIHFYFWVVHPSVRAILVNMTSQERFLRISFKLCTNVQVWTDSILGFRGQRIQQPENCCQKVCFSWFLLVVQEGRPTVTHLNSLLHSLVQKQHIPPIYLVLAWPRTIHDRAHWPFKLGALAVLQGLTQGENYTERDGFNFMW